MSDSISALLIKDSRIADITEKQSYAIFSSGSQVTAQQISATSKSSSSIVFTVTVPSENIVIDRNILLRTNLNFNIEINAAGGPGLNPSPIGSTVFSYGLDNAFQAFPVNSLFTTSSSLINNCNVSVNLRDVLPQILALNNIRDFGYYNGMTPSYPDTTYATFAQGIGADNNALGSIYNNDFDVNFKSRGSFPLNSINVVHTWFNGPNQVVDNSLVCVTGLASETWVITIDSLHTEPIIGLSPYIYNNNEYNSQGLLGITNLAFNFNIGDLSRMWSCAGNNISKIYLNNSAFTTCELLLTYLSLQPTDLVQTKNVCPIMDLPRFISNSTEILPAFVPQVIGQPPTPPRVVTIISNSIQLSSIPDKFIIVARKQMGTQTTADSASFMCIQNIVMNFNNSSGLLSAFSQNQLWQMSQKAGSNQSWQAFSGFANGSNATGTGELVSTVGSVLVIPADQLSLPNYLCSGSQGNYNVQFQLSVYNTQQTPVNVEIVLICANSGVLVTQQGVSNAYVGLLNKNLVLKTNEEQSVDPVSSVEYQRLVGGAMGNSILSCVGKMAKNRMIGNGVSGGMLSGGSMAQQAAIAIGKKILSKKKAHNLLM